MYMCTGILPLLCRVGNTISSSRSGPHYHGESHVNVTNLEKTKKVDPFSPTVKVHTYDRSLRRFVLFYMCSVDGSCLLTGRGLPLTQFRLLGPKLLY